MQRDGLSKRYRTLLEISQSLASESHLDLLLRQIIDYSLDLTHSDASCLYLIHRPSTVSGQESTVDIPNKNEFSIWGSPSPQPSPQEGEGDHRKPKAFGYRASPSHLRFALARNFSRDVSELREEQIPLNDQSIAGYVALHGQSVVLRNAYRIPRRFPFTFHPAIDQKLNYRTQSVLAVPMFNQQREIIGVIQLLNKKKKASQKLTSPQRIPKNVIPYTRQDQDILLSFASQAAVAIERTRLYRELEQLVNSFVLSFTHALEIRNRTTSGHSQRVQAYALALLQALLPSPIHADSHSAPADFSPLHPNPRIQYGTGKNLSATAESQPQGERNPISQEQYEHWMKKMGYAALLHDIGKITVPEAILDKRTKLPPEYYPIISYRLSLYKEFLTRQGLPPEEEKKELQKVDRLEALITAVNAQPTLGPEEKAFLESYRNKTFTLWGGRSEYVLTEQELSYLLVEQGNLTPTERQVMENHVFETWEILKRVSWPRDMDDIPRIAASHHEKIDGSGYPWKHQGKDIPLEGRILAIVDIFEALTAKDRPYRGPMKAEEALTVLQQEVNRGHLDPHLFSIFVHKKVYALFTDPSGYVNPQKVENSPSKVVGRGSAGS